jgi:putative ATP-dependent endonuclease of OLD family
VRLNRVQVKNHSRIEDCDLGVRQHLVIVGPNDVGKSSLIRCLDLVLGATTASLYTRIQPDDFRDKANPFEVEVELTGLSRDEESYFPDETHVDPTTGQKHLRIRLTADLDADQTLSIRREAPDSGTGRQLSRPQVLALGWKTVGAAHSQTRDFRQERNSSLDDILSAIDLGSDKPGFDAAAAQFQAQLASSKVLDVLRKKLADQLTKALPDPLAKDDVLFVSGVTATEDVLGDVRLHLSRNGAVRSMTEQSDGARALFAIALYDLVSESANIVAIDEPEIHLHPTSQRNLARLLRSGANQKIVATHSPDIVGAFDAESIVTMKMGGRLVQPVSGFLTKQERLIALWWVRDKLEPLTARRVVLVEGPSDRIIVQRVAELTGRDLDRLGVSLAELGGAGDVVSVNKLFGSTGFKVDMSILIDMDAVADTAKSLGVNASDLKSRSVYVSDRDLEDEYVHAIGHDKVYAELVASQLFSRNELASCTPTGAGGALVHDDVAGFCRQKRRGFKVRAAIVAATLLDAKSAAKVTSVSDLLDEIAKSAL